MNLKNLIARFAFLLTLLAFLSGSAFAQTTWYVNNTDGDDLGFNGQAVTTPFKTIAKALASAADDDIIYVYADTYNEPAGNLTVDVEVTMVAVAFNGLTTVTINRDVEVDVTGAVSLGETGETFLINGDLTLTDGTLNITGANVEIMDGTLVTVDAGTLTAEPTYLGEVDVTYISAADHENGFELPSDLDGGTLTNAVAAGKVLTINKAVTMTDLDNSAGEDVIFEVAVVVDDQNAGIDNSGGGTIDFQAGAEVWADIDNSGATSVIQLNSSTLSIMTDATGFGAITITQAATSAIISDAAATVGNGTVWVDGDDDVTITGGEIPNLTIPATFQAVVDFSADVDLYGTFLLASDFIAAFDLGGFTMTLYGDFDRQDNTPGNFDANGGLVSFEGDDDQIFNPGASLELEDLTIDNNDNLVTMMASVIVLDDMLITATGNLELSTFNIRLQGAASDFTNDGSYISTPSTGYVIFENGGAGGTLQGAGDFSNLDIRDGNIVTLVTDVNFSGILQMRAGDLRFAAFDLNLDDVFVAIPHIYFYTDAGDMSQPAAGTLTVSTGVVYDLTFLESTNRTVDAEWTVGSALSLNNLTVSTDAGNTVLGPAGPSTVAGILTVDGTETLDLNAQTMTLVGAAMAHDVSGEVTNTELVVQGDGSSITGSVDNADLSSVEDLTIDLAAGETFTSTGLRNINGDLVHNDGTSSILLSDDDTAPVPVGPTFTGFLVLNEGELTFGMTDNGNTIAGGAPGLDLVAGTLILASDLVVTDQTDLFDATIDLGSFTLELQDRFRYAPATATGGSVIGDGLLYVTYANNGAGPWAVNFTLLDDLSVTNIEFDGAAGNTFEKSGGFDLYVTNSFTMTSGAFDLNAAHVYLTGDIFDFNGGTIPATTGIFYFNGDAMTATLAANLVMENVEFDFTTLTYATFVTVPATGPWDWTVEGDFVQTAGDVNLVDGDFIIDNNAGGEFTRVAGDWTMTTGFLVLMPPLATNWNTFDQGDDFVVDNLWIKTALGGNSGMVTFVTDQPFTVNNYLKLKGELDANTTVAVPANPTQLTLGDDALIERMHDKAVLTEEAAYLGGINLLYSTIGPITTTEEVEAPLIYDVTVEVQTDMDRSFGPITGTLTLEALLDSDPGVGDWEVGMGDLSTVVLVDGDGVTLLNAPLVPVGTLNVTYENATGGALVTTDNELDADNFVIGDVAVDGPTDNDDIKLHEDQVFTGLLSILDLGDLDLDGFDLTLEGGVSFDVDGADIVNSGAVVPLPAVWFGGANDQALTLSDDWVMDATYTVGISTTAGDEVVTVTGADMDYATNGATLYLDQGIFATGATNAFVLEQQSDANLDQGSLDSQPTQGFVKTAAQTSHVAGNIVKYLSPVDGDGNIDNGGAYDASIALTEVTFPVGSLPTSPAYYRPFKVYFNTLPTSAFTLTVSAVDADPEGVNGFPMTDTDLYGNPFTITRYADFYWAVKSTQTLQPQVLYDLEAKAEGYDGWAAQGIDKQRLVRRYEGNVANPWILQGGAAYDNSVDGTVPVVIVRNAEGAIASQGARFAYSFETSMEAGTIADMLVGQPIQNWEVLLDGVFTGGTGAYTYTYELSNVTVAAVVLNTDTLVISPFGDGTVTITVRATDVAGDFAETSFDFTYDSTVDVDDETGLPTEFALQQNYPNPFNPTTAIRFELPQESNVVLRIYNVLGQEVATLVNETMSAGAHTVQFNASQLSSGMYIYRIEAGDFVSLKKMMLLK